MAPVSIRKEISLPATSRFNQGSDGVIGVGAKGPGHPQSSAARPRWISRLKFSDSGLSAGRDVGGPPLRVLVRIDLPVASLAASVTWSWRGLRAIVLVKEPVFWGALTGSF